MNVITKLPRFFALAKNVGTQLVRVFFFKSLESLECRPENFAGMAIIHYPSRGHLRVLLIYNRGMQDAGLVVR